MIKQKRKTIRQAVTDSKTKRKKRTMSLARAPDEPADDEHHNKEKEQQQVVNDGGSDSEPDKGNSSDESQNRDIHEDSENDETQNNEPDDAENNENESGKDEIESENNDSEAELDNSEPSDGQNEAGNSESPEKAKSEDSELVDQENNDDVDQNEPMYPLSKKKHTAGIIYLSYIPEGLNVAKTREILSEFGNIGRIYFEPVKKLNKKTRPNHRFIEGWVEFEKKKVAKKVAAILNAKPIGGKRRTPYYDALWSIKYLHRFKWTHLSERLAYEKAVKDQRLRTEIAQAKREANYYAKALERSIRLKRQRKQGQVVDNEQLRSNIRLKKTDKEIRQAKETAEDGQSADKSLLMSIFTK